MFIESISYQQEEMPLLHWHQLRFARTQLASFGRLIYPDLQDAITRFQVPADEKKYKCRVVYSPQSLHVAFIPYQPRSIKKLLLKSAETIHYRFKSTDRSAFSALTKDLNQGEEVLITREGYLTDSSFSNLALLKNGVWWTPDTYLLPGVQRQYLLDAGILKSTAIHINDLGQYSKIRLLNAMNEWKHSWELPMTAIIQPGRI